MDEYTGGKTECTYCENAFSPGEMVTEISRKRVFHGGFTTGCLEKYILETQKIVLGGQMQTFPNP